MPVGKYVTYKCPKCGYKVTKFQGDEIYPGIDRCPKCGSKMKMVNSSISMPVSYMIRKILDVFNKRV